MHAPQCSFFPIRRLLQWMPVLENHFETGHVAVAEGVFCTKSNRWICMFPSVHTHLRGHWRCLESCVRSRHPQCHVKWWCQLSGLTALAGPQRRNGKGRGKRESPKEKRKNNQIFAPFGLVLIADIPKYETLQLPLSSKLEVSSGSCWYLNMH